MQETQTTMTTLETTLDKLVAEALERRQRREAEEKRQREERDRRRREEAINDFREQLMLLFGAELVAALDLTFAYEVEDGVEDGKGVSACWDVAGATFRLTSDHADLYLIAPDGKALLLEPSEPNAADGQGALGDELLCAIGDWRARDAAHAQARQVASRDVDGKPLDDCPF